MAKSSTDRGSQYDDPDERWAEARLKRVRNHVWSYSGTAIKVRHLAKERLTTKQFRTAPLIAYTSRRHGLEFMVCEEIFRDVVCSNMPWRAVLRTLWVAGLLNRSKSGGLVTRDFPAPLNWAQVVSIKPKIREYFTAAEEAEDE